MDPREVAGGMVVFTATPDSAVREAGHELGEIVRELSNQ